MQFMSHNSDNDSPEIPGLSTVHDAVQDAAFKRLGSDLKPTTVRVSVNALEKADIILQRHGITFSEWVRACTDNLIRDYEFYSK